MMPRPARRLARSLIGAGLLASAMACARRPAAVREPGATLPPTTVVVENRSWEAQTIYVARGSQRLRLGDVGSSLTETFLLPENLVFGATRLRFIAAPVGSSTTAISEVFIVEPGDQVRLIVPSR